MTTRRAKKVSFNKSSKIVEIDQEEDLNNLDLEIENQNSSRFNNDKNNESNKSNNDDFDDDFDPDTMDIDLTTGKKRRGRAAARADAAAGTAETDDKAPVEALATSLGLIPYHLPLLLYSILSDGTIMNDTAKAIQKTFFNLIAIALIYSVLVGEMAKLQRNPNKKSSGPTGAEFLYTSVSFPISVALSIPIYLTFLLFGAPAGPLNTLTFYLSAHVSLISFFPLLNVYKFTDKNAKQIWWKLLTFQVPNWKLNQIYCSSLGGLIGCWLGVIPIPLDWDRDWQDWPITLLIGSYAGAFVGSVASYLYGLYVLSKFKKNT